MPASRGELRALPGYFCGKPHNTCLYLSPVEVLYPEFPIPAMIHMWKDSLELDKEKFPMHELLIAIAFLGMIIAPAIVAVNPEPAKESK
jgi:hypothetical protein